MKKTNEEFLKEFHVAFGLAVDEEPTPALLKLRKSLIEEEVKEFFDEIDTAISKLENGEEVDQEHYANMLKELTDVQIVLSGTVVSIKQFRNFSEAIKRVHASNMSKLDDDGKPAYREDGKVLKGKNYTKPDLSDLV